MTQKKAFFMGDIFRVHTMLKGGKFSLSTVKLTHLLQNTVECLGYQTKMIEDPDTPEIAALYELMFGHFGNVYTWAQRSQILSDRVAEFYSILLEGVDLVIGFELPESLYTFCDQNGILVFDFSFHFIRFESDYSVMVRTNSAPARALLSQIRHQINYTDILSKLSGPSQPSDFDDREEIGVFLIQTRFDRSKFDGNGGILDDLELIRSANLPLTFYKPHPMEHRPEIELFLSNQGAQPFPAHVNIYTYLARYGYKTRLYTISSGLAAEGEIIGVKDIQYLSGFPWVVDGHEKYSTSGNRMQGRFIPVDNRVFTADFARALISGSRWTATAPLQSQFSLKDFWNVKWS